VPGGAALAPLSPQPPFHPHRGGKGEQSPHLIFSLRLGHHWPLPWSVVGRGSFSARAGRRHAIRRLAEAKKSNAAVSPLSRPLGERGVGGESGNSSQNVTIKSTFAPPVAAVNPWSAANVRNPGRSLAEATKSNVAVSPPLSPAGRERGWGREWASQTERLNQTSRPRRARTKTAVASPDTITNTRGKPSQGEKSINAPDSEDATSAPSV